MVKMLVSPDDRYILFSCQCYEFTESRKCQRELVEKGKSGKFDMVGLSVCFYISLLIACV